MRKRENEGRDQVLIGGRAFSFLDRPRRDRTLFPMVKERKGKAVRMSLKLGKLGESQRWLKGVYVEGRGKSIGRKRVCL